MAATMVDTETGELVEREAPEVDYGRIRRWVIKREGKDYIQYAGLVDLLHQQSAGEFEIVTRLEQAPGEGNGQTAIVSAVVTMAGRTAAGLGDANPGNVSRAMAPHLLRMAETRAKGRALRDLLNVPFVTAEELSGEDARESPPVAQDARRAPFGPQAGPRPVSPAAAGEDAISLDGRRYTRTQVVARKHHWIAAAQDAKLFVPPMGAKGGPPPDDAPLPDQVDWNMETKHRLEVRSGDRPRAAAPPPT